MSLLVGNPLVKVDVPCALLGAQMGLYAKDAFYLREDAAAAYRVACAHFQKMGYALLAVDGYRPSAIQAMLYDCSEQDGVFVRPTEESNHPKGLAVDVTLLKGSDKLDFQTVLGTWGPDSYADRVDGLSKTILENRRLLQMGMLAAGFEIYKPEWWHFDFPSKHPSESSDERPQGMPPKSMDQKIQAAIQAKFAPTKKEEREV